MTHTPRNVSSNQRASGDAPTVAVFVFLVWVLFSFPDVLRAGDVPSLLSSASTRTTADVEIETRILQALRKDAQLGPLNLGVSMSGGTALLSGPVSTAELKQRAIKIVQQIDGVRSVSTKDLYVSSSARRRKRVSIVLQDDPPTQTRAASPLSPSTVPAASPGTGSRVTLLAPEMTAPLARASEPARLTAHPRPALPSASIAAAVEGLRKHDPRYQQIRVRVQGATVYISPGNTASEDAMTFAQAVRRLPGVQHVIMDSSSR